MPFVDELEAFKNARLEPPAAPAGDALADDTPGGLDKLLVVALANEINVRV